VHFCNEKHPKSEDFRCFLELLTRFELVTSSLPTVRNPLQPLLYKDFRPFFIPKE